MISKRGIAILLVVAFGALVACLTVVPWMSANNAVAHSGCMGTGTAPDSGGMCEGHSSIDAIVQSDAMSAITHLLLKAGIFATAFLALISIFPQRGIFLCTPRPSLSGQHSTSWLLHCKTVVIRP